MTISSSVNFLMTSKSSRMVILIVGVVGCVMSSSAATPTPAAYRYELTSRTEGAYSRSSKGVVTASGSDWRIDFDIPPAEVTDLNAMIGTPEGLVAINDSLHTWFRLPSRRRLAIDASLFSYGQSATASKIRVKLDPPSGVAGKEAETMTRVVTFAYGLRTTIQGEAIKGEVRGTMRIVTRAEAMPGLPWKPLDLTSGIAEVDDALRQAMSQISGVPLEVTVEVSRTLEGGVTLSQVITRTMTPLTTASVQPRTFIVPPDYKYEEPTYGAAGTTKVESAP
jgi:hypothetical protein